MYGVLGSRDTVAVGSAQDRQAGRGWLCALGLDPRARWRADGDVGDALVGLDDEAGAADRDPREPELAVLVAQRGCDRRAFVQDVEPGRGQLVEAEADAELGGARELDVVWPGLGRAGVSADPADAEVPGVAPASFAQGLVDLDGSDRALIADQARERFSRIF